MTLVGHLLEHRRRAEPALRLARLRPCQRFLRKRHHFPRFFRAIAQRRRPGQRGAAVRSVPIREASPRGLSGPRAACYRRADAAPTAPCRPPAAGARRLRKRAGAGPAGQRRQGRRRRSAGPGPGRDRRFLPRARQPAALGDPRRSAPRGAAARRRDRPRRATTASIRSATAPPISPRRSKRPPRAAPPPAPAPSCCCRAPIPPSSATCESRPAAARA